MSFKIGKNEKAVEFTISSWTIIKIILVLVIAYLLYQIRDIIGIILISILFASIVGPGAEWCERKRIPRPIGVLIMYIIGLSILGIIIGILIPPLVNEVQTLATNFSSLWSRVVSGFTFIKDQTYPDELSQSISNGLTSLQTVLSRALSGAFFAITGIFGGIVSLVVILVLTFYTVIQKDSFKKMCSSFLPPVYIDYLSTITSKIQQKITLWARGQIILSLAVAIMVYIGLLILRIDYALVLALFAGIAEFIPYAGPFLAGTVAVFFAMTKSPFSAFLVAIFFIVMQQLENHILVPKIMQRAVGLNPIVSIIAILIGAKLGGILGVLFAIPTVTALDVILKEIINPNPPAS